MREIKFRAWSPTFGKWREDWSISVYGAVLDLNAERLDDDLILCQYTGLKDKNGKEIYEGDIVQIVYDAQPPLGPGVIEFGDFCIGMDDWGIKHQTPCFAISWPGESDKTEASGFGGRENIEVIGNIYENPELLEN